MKKILHISINQLELSPYHVDSLQDGNNELMYQNHVQIMAWSPFAGGKFSTRKILKRNVL